MTILVTGATGRVGRNVVEQLTRRGASVRVLTRDPAKAGFSGGVAVAKGDLLDIDALRAAFAGVRTLFLLNAVTGDEFTQAIVTLNVAREAGCRSGRLPVGVRCRPSRQRAALRGEVRCRAHAGGDGLQRHDPAPELLHRQ